MIVGVYKRTGYLKSVNGSTHEVSLSQNYGNTYSNWLSQSVYGSTHENWLSQSDYESPHEDLLSLK